MIVVAAYDISADGRRSKVAALLQSFGDRVQRSVFVLDITDTELADLRARIAAIVDLDDDSVYVFGQCGRCWENLTVIGQADRPERVLHWAVF